MSELVEAATHPCIDIIINTMPETSPVVTRDPRFLAGRKLVERGLADEAIAVYATLLEETRQQYGDTSIETAPAYYEYGNSLLRAVAKNQRQQEEQDHQQQQHDDTETTKEEQRSAAAAAAENRQQSSEPKACVRALGVCWH